MTDTDPARSDHRRRRIVIVLAVVTITLWCVAVALATTVLVLIGRLPGEDPDRDARANQIATGVFVSFALPATAATIGLVAARRARARGRDV
ncbi:hypothetical protein [Curtobacterium sp. B18]|uniref:hypothetical protein n=1 Tax=Curtobacterium sp. B18 TaxID=95614 RepID=UPI0003467E9E|nr:hypothetical protein [Curtobacterium sp. B18]